MNNDKIEIRRYSTGGVNPSFIEDPLGVATDNRKVINKVVGSKPLDIVPNTFDITQSFSIDGTGNLTFSTPQKVDINCYFEMNETLYYPIGISYDSTEACYTITCNILMQIAEEINYLSTSHNDRVLQEPLYLTSLPVPLKKVVNMPSKIYNLATPEMSYKDIYNSSLSPLFIYAFQNRNTMYFTPLFQLPTVSYKPIGEAFVVDSEYQQNVPNTIEATIVNAPVYLNSLAQATMITTICPFDTSLVISSSFDTDLFKTIALFTDEQNTYITSNIQKKITYTGEKDSDVNNYLLLSMYKALFPIKNTLTLEYPYDPKIDLLSNIKGYEEYQVVEVIHEPPYTKVELHNLSFLTPNVQYF